VLTTQIPAIVCTWQIQLCSCVCIIQRDAKTLWYTA